MYQTRDVAVRPIADSQITSGKVEQRGGVPAHLIFRLLILWNFKVFYSRLKFQRCGLITLFHCKAADSDQNRKANRRH